MSDLSEAVARARAKQQEEEAEVDDMELEEAPSLEDLAAKTIKTTINVRGLPIRVEVDPDAVAIRPMAAFTRLSRNEGDADDLMELVTFLCAVIKWWNLRETSKSAATVPLTEERLAKLGIPLIGGIMTALMDAMRMGEDSGNRQQRRSLPTRTRAKRPYYAK